ncbi:MAG TPA: alpha/beta hydrolase [Xanthobacteraceae bacterium]|nr:alpha/beta hydrolase [Xanthobacteraceae bacterium]
MPVLSVDGAELSYQTYGEGTPFLFLARTAGHGEAWKLHQVAEFSRDHRVIICDQRGTGKSSAGGTDFSTQRLADDAAALLQHLGARNAVVLGHSNGGRVAQALALDHPELVSRLILASSGGAHHSQGIPIRMCVELVEKGYARYVREHSLDVGFTRGFAQAHPDIVARVLGVLLADPPPLSVFLGHVVGRQGYDPTPRLKDLRIPTLVMVGDDENRGAQHGTTHKQFAERLVAAIPNAQLAVIPNQGHYYLYADPATTHRVIREFLAAKGRP